MPAYEPITLELLQRELGNELSEEQLKSIWDLRQPCITLVRETADGELCAESCIGGSPCLPSTLAWPDDPRGGKLQFICQINLSQLPPNEVRSLLPDKGMLYFFASQRCSRDGETEYNGSWKVLYHPEDTLDASTTDLNLTAGPVLDVPVCKLSPVADTSLPFTTSFTYSDLDEDCEDPEELDYAMDEFLNSRNTYSAKYAGVNMEDAIPVHQMFGYISAPQGPELAPGHHCLLQINSDAFTGMCFLDAGTITFLISDADLRTHSWDQVWMLVHTA